MVHVCVWSREWGWKTMHHMRMRKTDHISRKLNSQKWQLWPSDQGLPLLPWRLHTSQKLPVVEDTSHLLHRAWAQLVLQADGFQILQEQILRFLNHPFTLNVLDIQDNVNRLLHEKENTALFSILADSSDERRKLYPAHGKGWLSVSPTASALISSSWDKSWRLTGFWKLQLNTQHGVKSIL